MWAQTQRDPTHSSFATLVAAAAGFYCLILVRAIPRGRRSADLDLEDTGRKDPTEQQVEALRKPVPSRSVLKPPTFNGKGEVELFFWDSSGL